MVGKSGQPFKKSRNYGESADDLQDRLDLVAALLALADEEITIPSDSLKAQFKLEWVKENELRVSGTVEQKQGNLQRKPTEKGITQDDLGVLLETYRQGKILAAARKEIIQNALSCLRDLEILQEHQSAKNQGYWKFSLCLKHQTAKREDNLQVIKDKWQEAFAQLPELKPLTPTTATLQRCILGLRGNYQDAQQKLAEICHVLQTRFKDKTLSITKVEQGSIILIVESSQTGYEQFKRLIGQEIAGFAVDYAIDEWQAICRQMLIDRKPLTSNTVIGRVYGDRNLIDEDLFVDLALVKPKRNKTEKHPQEIDPEKGSDLYNREEVEKRLAYPEFLDEVISNGREKQMAIIGEPGAGKTTLLQKLAFWLLQETDDLVIWVDLAELGNQPLGDYLEQKWLKEALGQSREAIKGDWEQKFKGGAVWLLLDGLDEMSQSDQQALNFRGWVMNASIIVTCRLNLWQANPRQLQGFQTYLTQPFQDEQVQEFIHRWFPVEAEAESLWSQLQAAGKERIKDLCRNPLRLTLLCATWKVEDALPETTAELYAGFVESMYAWKETAFEVTEEDKEQLNAALGVLAKASLEAETGRFRLTHRLVCEHLGKPKTQGSLFPLALRLGWLNEVGVAAENPREKVYGFYHATFQEYFAALAVNDWDYFLPKDHVDCPVAGKRYRIFEPQWKQVILLWLGREDVGDEEKEGFIRGLVEFEDGVRDWDCNKEFFLSRSSFLSRWSSARLLLETIKDFRLYCNKAYFLAAIAINEFKACSMASGIVRQVVKWGVGYFHPEKQEWRTFADPVKEASRTAILETIRPLVITELTNLLDHCQDTATLKEVAFSLWQIGQSAVLLNLIATTESKRIRWGAVMGLVRTDPGNPETIAALVNLVHSSVSNPRFIRIQAAMILGNIGKGNPEAISVLLNVIDSTKDESVRKEAAESLGKIDPGNSEAITALLNLIATTEDERTRLHAAETLGKIDPGNPEAIAALLNLIATTEDEKTRLYAAETLGKIDPDNPEAITALVNLIATTEDKWTRWQTTRSLEEIGQDNPEAIAALLNLIATTEDEKTRLHAAETLGKIDPGNPEAIAALLNLIATTENEKTRLHAAETLGKIDPGNPEAIAALLNLIATTEDEKTRLYAAETLGKIAPGNSEAITALLNLIATTKDENIRWHAAETLGKIDSGNPEAIAALVNLLHYSTHYTSINIVREKAKILGNIVSTTEAYLGVVSALKNCLSRGVYQNDYYEAVKQLHGNLGLTHTRHNLERFYRCYELLWNCAENLPYPEFYQAWHHPPTAPHPEITDPTPHNSETSFPPINLAQTLQNQPILTLNAQPLANETREGEIALTLSELIWDTTCPDEDPPEPTTPAQLRRHLKQLQRRQLLPHRALLLTDCEHPTPELISFCETLTGVIAVAFLTDDPLDAPLKGFPPNQPNLISAIKTWLEEI